jgi:hypothetical protein
MKKLSACMLALFLISCSDADQVSLPPQAALSTDNLTFLDFSDAAFAAAEKNASFWAVPGQARHVALRYADTGGEFMRFEVGANSLQTSDSVLISVAVDANGAFTFHFSPSGLQFNPHAPARLRINYARVRSDVNNNGYTDLFDTLLLVQAGVWKRELPGLPWISIPSLNILDRVEAADVYDFTSFGMAVD